MKFEGRCIFKGKASGKVLKLDEAFSFLGGVDTATGELRVGNGGNMRGRVFVFPRGKGSTVGSFTMYDLSVRGNAPAAVINQSAETIVTTGAVISSIPMVDSVDVDLIFDGDEVVVEDSTVTIEGVTEIETVSSALIKDGKVLMLHRPDDAKSFPSKWSLVSGKIEKGESPDEAAIREIMEETQIKVSKPKVAFPYVYIREGNIIWKVWPFLFDVDSEPILNPENIGFEWVDPEDTGKKDTVPKLTETVDKLLKN